MYPPEVSFVNTISPEHSTPFIGNLKTFIGNIIAGGWLGKYNTVVVVLHKRALYENHKNYFMHTILPVFALFVVIQL